MKKGLIVKFFSIVFIILLILITVSLISFGADEKTPTTIKDPDKYNPLHEKYPFKDLEEFIDTTGVIVDAIRVIGIVVSVVVLLVLGIKYMVGSASEKAEYKKSMIPYLIGVFIFFTLSQVLSIIITVMDSIEYHG